MIKQYDLAPREGFERLFKDIRDDLMAAPSVDVGEWQSIHGQMIMKELLNVVFSMPLPNTAQELGTITGARLPWAEDHFLERVGGQPLNPSPSEAWWPFAKKKAESTNADHKSEGEAFSHTYPERMWPKFANQPVYDLAEHDPLRDFEPGQDENYGIRFKLGDLMDVVKQLVKAPLTRQAYLPIWFPEDTGGAGGKRVPCTLGYHFLIREGKLNITYFMRSTDLIRHFQDDVYMAGRLAQWMVDQINAREPYAEHEASPDDQLEVGDLIFHTANMHIFAQDVDMLNYWISQGKTWY